MTPPSKLQRSSRAVAASTSRARQESVPIKKAAPAKSVQAKKAPAKKAPLTSVDGPRAKKAAAPPPPPVSDEPVISDETSPTTEPVVIDPGAVDPEAADVELDDVALQQLDVDLEAEPLTADVVVDLETEEVVAHSRQEAEPGRRRRVGIRAGRRGEARRGAGRGRGLHAVGG